MRLSRSFIPTLREIPSEAQIASHRLMLRAGLIRQTASGIYAWLPAGLRVLRRISQIVREEQDADWRPGGADADPAAGGTVEAGAAATTRMVRRCFASRDRHERDLLYGPTNEEMITDLFGQSA